MPHSFSKILWNQGVGAKAVAERNRLIKKIVLLLAVVTFSALFCVWSRVRIVQMGYEVSELRNLDDQLKKQMNHLEVEVERSKSPARLQKAATGVLEMHPPSGEEMVFVKKAGNR